MLWSDADLYYCALNFPIGMLHISRNQQLFDNQHSPLYLNKHKKSAFLPSFLFQQKRRFSRFAIHLLSLVFRQYRTNELVQRRMNFSSDAMADFEGLLEVNRKICQQQMAEKASPTLPTNCAVLP